MYRPIAAVAAFALLSACAPIEDMQEIEAASTRALLFEEDFDAQSLDRSKWNVIGMDFWVNNDDASLCNSFLCRFTPGCLLRSRHPRYIATVRRAVCCPRFAFR